MALAQLLTAAHCWTPPARPPTFTRRELGGLAGAAGLAAASSGGVLLPASAGGIPPQPYEKQPGFKLNTGQAFPTASFGLQVYDDATAQKLTSLALEVGYRNFFASVLAKNQVGFARAIKESGVPRYDLFICGSVLSNRVSGREAARDLSAKGCRENMEAFNVGGITYLDSIMLDYPGPDAESIKGQWEALEDMQAKKLTKSICVSNFNPKQLDTVIGMGGTVPCINQLPYGVGFSGYYGGNAASVLEANRKRGILVQAWSPLRKALSGEAKAACAEIGKGYGKSAAQVGLRFLADQGVAFTTQTKTRSHFEEDLDIFDFKLSAQEITRLSSF